MLVVVAKAVGAAGLVVVAEAVRGAVLVVVALAVARAVGGGVGAPGAAPRVRSGLGGRLGVGSAFGFGAGVGLGASAGVGVGLGVTGAVGAGVGLAVGGGTVGRGLCEGADARAGDRPAGPATTTPRPGPATPLTASMVAVAAVVMPMPIPELAHPPNPNMRPRVGIWAIHAPRPMVVQRRPTDTLRKARTMTGSSCVPATRTSSLRAASTLMGSRYGRGAVITSKTSATATMRAAREISGPFSRCG